MKLKNFIITLLVFFISVSLNAQQRKTIYIPDIPGFKTIKCDFHMHTVFSDGSVWPTTRIEEAWLEGLDAISITDHIEYRPHSTDIVSDHNRSFDIASPIAEQKGIILVKGAEITRPMPPGHLNVLFIKNANLLEREDVNDALKEARDQGAFIFWNHPSWKVQQPDTTLWWNEHTELLENDMLHGIEVFNGEYCAEALNWANEKDLAILSNTDVHGPMNLDLTKDHRPMTLVFADQKTEESLKEALFEKRSVAYYDNTLIGSEKFLEPLFFASIEIPQYPVHLTNKKVVSINIKNTSDIDYTLELVQPSVGFDSPEDIFIKAHHSTNIELSGNSDEVIEMETLEIFYSVKNILISPDSNLIVTLSFQNL